MVVDGAIVVLENIFRHRKMGKSKKQAVIDGVNEVGSSIFASVLTTMAAFAPLFFMTGEIGEYFSYIPLGIVIALTGSILFDHFIIPVAAYKMMKDDYESKETKPKKSIFIKFQKYLFEKYNRIIEFSIRKRRTAIIVITGIFILGLFVFMTREKQFIPDGDMGQLALNIELSPITSIYETDNFVKKIEKEFFSKYKRKKIIKQYVCFIGSTGTSTSSTIKISSKSIATVIVELVKREKRKGFSLKKFEGCLRKYMSKLPGIRFKIKPVEEGLPKGDPVNVVISGPDLKILKRISGRFKTLIKENIDNVVNVRDNYGTNIPEIRAYIDRKAANFYGVPIANIAKALSILYNGYETTNFYYGNEELKVKVKLNRNFRKGILNFNSLSFLVPSTGEFIPFKRLVKIKVEPGLSVVARENLQRSITVKGGAYGRSSTEVMQDVKKLILKQKLPYGYSVKFRGESEMMDESFNSLKVAFIGGILLIYIIITLQLNSFIQPLSIMATILLSVSGVAFSMLISGAKIGMMTMFGFVSLAGIVVNDAIVLLTYINDLRKNGLNREEAIIKACKTRIKPILMTTVTTIMGLMPLVLALGGWITEFYSPMGMVIIGGLLFATLQTLVAVPIIYTYLEDLSIFTAKALKYVKSKIQELIN